MLTCQFSWLLTLDAFKQADARIETPEYLSYLMVLITIYCQENGIIKKLYFTFLTKNYQELFSVSLFTILLNYSHWFSQRNL